MIWLLLLFQSAFAIQDVQNSICVRPKKNPDARVGAIYLHGLFPAHPELKSEEERLWMINLESSNRSKLQALADRMGVTIAVPVSSTISESGTRRWPVSEKSGTAAKLLSTIEKSAEKACGKLDSPRTMIGFSNGGYMAREIALQCAAKKPTYDTVIMIGAMARQGSAKGREKCAKLVAIRGNEDNQVNECLERNKQKKCIRSIPFEKKAAEMIDSIGGTGLSLPPFDGGHELPPNDILAQYLGAPTPPLASQPGSVTPTGGHVPDKQDGGFLTIDDPATQK